MVTLADGPTVRGDLLLVGSRPRAQRRPARPGDGGHRRRPGRPGASSTTTSAPPPTASSRSATSSSPYQLKHVANHEAEGRAAQPRAPRMRPGAPTTGSCRRRCSPTRRSRPSGRTEAQCRATGLDYVVEDPGVRRHRLRLGDGGRHRLLQADRRPRHGQAARRAHPRPAGVDGHPAVIQAMSFGLGAQGDGLRPVLDPPRTAGSGGERTAGARSLTVARCRVAPNACRQDMKANLTSERTL